jgi:NAD-dependent dihydropyrimidine dehydrogenase PreA subunit
MYVIGPACVDVLDRTCLTACPVDCIYEGARKLYIHPEECIDCGACETVCPVEAIAWERELDEAAQPHAADAIAFFYDTLPGRSEPLGEPAGAREIGPLGVDTPLVQRVTVPTISP